MVPNQTRNGSPDRLICGQEILKSGPTQTKILVRQSIRQKALVEAANCQQVGIAQHCQGHSENGRGFCYS